MSDYGYSIVEICMACGLASSVVVTVLFRSGAWRLGVFLVGVAGVLVYIAIQPTGYDEWDRFEALFYGGGALIGWALGFGFGEYSRSRRRVTKLEKRVDDAVAAWLERGWSLGASVWRASRERAHPRSEMPPLPGQRPRRRTNAR